MNIKKFIKVGKAKYNLILDNNLSVTLNEEVILNNDLLLKKTIDKKTLEKLMRENNVENIISKCIHYISVRIRSKKEMYTYLNKITDDKNIIDNVIKRLEDNKYINDEVFTQLYINDKINLTNYGTYKIRNDLLMHNIDKNIIDKYINKVDDSILRNKINKIISNGIKNNDKYSKKMLIAKLTNKLISLGYDKEMINEEFNNYEIEENGDIIKKEFDKIYNILTLKNKYDEYTLKNKIIQKMMQKGYSYSEINKLFD